MKYINGVQLHNTQTLHAGVQYTTPPPLGEDQFTL